VTTEDAAGWPYCPRCRVRLPQNARHCGACGIDVSPLRQQQIAERARRATASRAARLAYDPAGRFAPRHALSSVARTEANPVQGERIAPLHRRFIASAVDLIALAVIWISIVGALASVAPLVYSVLGERSIPFVSPIFVSLAVTAPFWTLLAFNAQGWSPGQRLLNLRVLNSYGEPPGLRAGLTRTLAVIGSLLALGALWSLWDHDRRTLYDRLAGTRVIQLLR
jgi:uncharacterized RDD family membrane protein YckC